MCSDSLKVKEAVAAEESEVLMSFEEAKKLKEFEAQIKRSIQQFQSGLGRTFDDKDEFLNYLRNL
jgi:hypothetical protein